MKIHILNIGDELLIGQVVNTNAATMAEILEQGGYRLSRIVMVGDPVDEIMQAMEQSIRNADVVLLSGGLGPTSDDRTREALCRFFSCGMHTDESALANIRDIFERHAYKMSPANLKQAEVPDACTVIPNPLGTSPGMWFNTNGKVVCALPGVPFEMERMLREEIVPRLKDMFPSANVLHRTVLTQGVGESFLAERIADWENALPPSISLAYLPQAGMVRIRLSAAGENMQVLKDETDRQIELLTRMIPEYVFGFDQETLEGVAGKLLLLRGKTLATAESCTGGYIAHLITTVPGSSAYFKGSVVAYNNDVKTSVLNVDPEVLEREGAVSREVVCRMADAARKLLKADYSLAVSGIMGPEGGSPQKPVGTVWIAVSTPLMTQARLFRLGDERMRNIRRTALSALNMLRTILLEEMEG
jgi:nicotinamide-nucleotide amidase